VLVGDLAELTVELPVVRARFPNERFALSLGDLASFARLHDESIHPLPEL